MTQEQSHKQSQATTKVVEAFGGARSFAVKLGVPVSMVEHWLARGEIPRDRHAAIRTAAGSPCAVVADESEYFSLRHMEIQVAYRGQPAEKFTYPFNFQDRHWLF